MKNPNKNWERLDQIIQENGFRSVSEFSRHIGLNRSENLYQIKRGTNGISRDLAYVINQKFPKYPVSYLMFGETNYGIKLPDMIDPQTKFATLVPGTDFAPQYPQFSVVFFKELRKVIPANYLYVLESEDGHFMLAYCMGLSSDKLHLRTGGPDETLFSATRTDFKRIWVPTGYILAHPIFRMDE